MRSNHDRLLSPNRIIGLFPSMTLGAIEQEQS